jgi:AraC-like DNA-binding protein
MASVYIPAGVRSKLVDHETFRLLSRAREFIGENYDRPLTLADAADHAFLSPFHFHRLFQRAFGETPHDFLTRRRLEEAQRLLAKSAMTVAEVCFEVGYESPSSFSALFERRFAARPSEFRRVYSLPDRWFLRNIPGCHAWFYSLPGLVQAPPTLA